MAKRTQIPERKQPADLPAHVIPDAIRKLERRLQEVSDADPESYQGDLAVLASSLCSKLDDTLVDIFGLDTFEYDRVHLRPSDFFVMRLALRGGHPLHEKVAAFRKGQASAISKINTIIAILREKYEDAGAAPAVRALHNFRHLDLQPDIERPAGKLYRRSHYSNSLQ